MSENNTIPTVLPEQFRKKYFNESGIKDIYYRDFNSFYLHKIENSCQSLILPSLPYRSTANECVLLTDGEMVRSSGLETYSVESSSMFFVPAGQITTIESVSRNAKGFYCHFDTSMLIERFANLQLVEEFAFLRTTVNPVMPLPAKTISRLVYLFERINEEQASTMAEGIIQSYLLTIFFEVKQYHLPGVYTATSPAQRLNEKFKQLVTSDFKSRKTVAEYAHLLSVTPNHLNKSVKSASGKSPSVWIDESIILEAKVLLYQSGLTVAEISYEMGLDDPSYFGRLFKKYTGMTPTEFRNRAKIRKDSSR